MRILMISDVYFPRVNGVSTSIQTYRESLSRKGVTIDLVVPQYDKATADEENIYRIAARAVPLDPEDRLMNKKKLYQQARKLLDINNYDLIHIQTPFLAHYAGIKLAREYKLPVVETYHTYFEEYLYNYIPFLPKQLLRTLVRRFTRSQCNALDTMIVPSSAMLEAVRNYGVKTPVEIIPTGIKPELFNHGDGDAFREKHGIPLTTPVIVHVGRVSHEKNIDFLLRMHQVLLDSVPETVLLIAGEGPAVKYLKAFSAKLGIDKNVRFIGYLDRKQELQNCYAAGNIFVFASRTETQGLVLLEAMALGVPVVSTAMMGTIDILSAGRGALVAEEDTDHFANLVTLVLKNIGLQARLSREAREYAQEWSIDKLSNKMLGFYEHTVRNAQLQESECETSKQAADVVTSNVR